MAGRKCPSQAETMIGGSCFLFTAYPLHAAGTRGCRAPVTLFVLRGGDKEDRYRESDKNRHRQPVGFLPYGRSPSLISYAPPLSLFPAFHPCTSFERHASPYIDQVSPYPGK